MPSCRSPFRFALGLSIALAATSPVPAQELVNVFSDSPETKAQRIREMIGFLEQVQAAVDTAQDLNNMASHMVDAWDGLSQGDWDGLLEAQYHAMMTVSEFNDGLVSAETWLDDEDNVNDFWDTEVYGSLVATTDAMESNMRSQRNALLQTDRFIEWSEIRMERQSEILAARRDASNLREHLDLNGASLSNMGNQLAQMSGTLSTYISHEMIKDQNREWLAQQQDEQYRDFIDVSERELESLAWGEEVVGKIDTDLEISDHGETMLLGPA